MREIKRIGFFLVGLFCCSVGTHLAVRANIGLPPWDAFSMGISYLMGIEFGTATIVIGGAILLLDLVLGEKIGFGTLGNIMLIGWFLNLLGIVSPVPMAQSYWIGIPMLVIGQLFVSIGIYLYISSAYGCGPRDTLMVALGKRVPNVPIGPVKGLIEGVVLLLGWLLGAKVGIGTVISVFSSSLILQETLRFFHFEVRSVAHEGVFDTLRRIANAVHPKDTKEEQTK